jgi:hypothetical protein
MDLKAGVRGNSLSLRERGYKSPKSLNGHMVLSYPPHPVLLDLRSRLGSTAYIHIGVRREKGLSFELIRQQCKNI